MASPEDAATDLAPPLDDESRDPMFKPAVVDPIVDVLAELAGDGRALEFGVGTGRIAIPLADRGVGVHGIDLSKESLDRLRAGCRDDAWRLLDDESRHVPPRLPRLQFDHERDDLGRAGHDLPERRRPPRPGGVFVIETMIPDLRRLPLGERFVVFDGTDTHWGIDEYDVANQGLISHHFNIRGDQVTTSSGAFRYVWPAELDLMAELAGLRLRERWAGWQREPFTSESRAHVSVWEKPPEA